MMTVVLEWNDDEAWFEPARRLALTKGAPHEVLRHCRWIAVGRGRQPLDEDRWREVVAANDELAGGGCRVLALAVRPGEGDLLGMGAQDLERELVFVGLLALYDPPRPGVEQAIAQCRSAGIKVTMVTGDYGLTAQSIARQIGLLTVPTHGGRGLDPVRVINGSSLDHLSDAQLRQLVKYRSRLVFARMAPEQKLRLVQAYRDLGDVVAVTGDGVNDAPALRMAHAGVAMGLAGTDVAREAADIVLLDDDFTTIVSAVRYGRSVYANIRKFLTYVLVSNVAEVMPFLAMATLQLPAALTVLQILAVDLGTDLLPALALGAERAEPQVMAMSPHGPGEPLMNRFLVLRAYLFLGLIEGILAIAGYLLAWQVQGDGWHELRALAPRILHQSATPEVMALQRRASAMAFAAIVSGQIGCVVACRSERHPSRSLPPFENSLLWLGIAIEVLVLAALLYAPPLAGLFQMDPFPAPLWLWLLCGPLVLLADEGRKAWAGRGAGGHRCDGALKERPS
jgi:Ca2+-transporting ATPase